jgi:lipoprotein-releasing system permease protein
LYKLFLTLRYLRKNRIAYFAIAAVTLCVAMVLIVMSVMGGFLDTVKQRARGLLGDIVVDNSRYEGFPLYEEFINEIKQWPEVVAATPVIYSFGLLHFPDSNARTYVSIVGIRLHEVYEVNAFKQSLYYDSHYPGTTTLAEQQQPLAGIRVADEQVILPAAYQSALDRSRGDPNAPPDDSSRTGMNLFLAEKGLNPVPGVYDLSPSYSPEMVGDPWPGLIIGRDIIAKREPDGSYERSSLYPRGCMATVLMGRGEGSQMDQMRQPFRYTDDSRTGIYEIDSRHVYCDFDLLQKDLWMEAAERADGSGMAPARCSQIQIRIAPGVDANALTDRLTDAYAALLNRPEFDLTGFERSLVRYVRAFTWEESQAHVIDPVEKEKQLVTILFAIISLVAVVLILCILYMIALQKTRDIGILKSVGGSSAGVACIFLIYGAAVGVVGSALGTALAYQFINHINEVQEHLIAINPGWQVWDRSVYSFDEIPSTIRLFDVVLVVLAAVAASTVGAAAAAWRAGSMEPVEALRYE